MRKRLLLFVALCSLTGTTAVHAQFPLIDYQGFAWETGGFPASNPGDFLNLVAIVDDLDAVFGIDLGVDEVTVYATGLVSTGEIPLGGGFLAINYVGGTLDVYQDPSMDAAFGINPANATVPSTFTNGGLFLGAVVTSFFLFYDTTNGVGSYEGNITFTAGSGLASVQGIEADGYTFGGTLNSIASSGNIPEGYDLQIDGAIEVRVSIAVEEKTWGGVKDLYRR